MENLKKTALSLGASALFALSAGCGNGEAKATAVVSSENTGGPQASLATLMDGIYEVSAAGQTCTIAKDAGLNRVGYVVSLGCTNSGATDLSFKRLQAGSFLTSMRDGFNTLHVGGPVFADGKDRDCTVLRDLDNNRGYAVSLGCTPSVY